MRTRLSHLLVAGLVACATWPCALAGETSAETSAVLPIQEAASLTGASLAASDGAPKVRLDIPGYKGTPRCQVLGKPLRIVLDLPGVVMSETINRQQVKGLVGGAITKARIAQFSPAPAPVTRVVFEVGTGTQVDLASDASGLTLAFAKGQGPTKIAMGTPALEPAHPLVAVLNAPPAAAIPAPVVQKVAAALPPAAPLASLPNVGIPYQAFPQLALNSTLPTLATAQPQEKMPERQDSTLGRSGRTLGEGAQRYSGSKITIDVKGAELSAFLRLIADHAKMNLIADPDVAGQTYEFKFTDTPWDLVLDTILKHAGLGKEINNGIIRVAKVEKLQKEEEDRKRLEEAKALAGDLVSVTRPLSFAKAGEAKAVVEKVLTKRGSLIVDDRTNTLILTDLPKNLKLLDELLLQMDVPIQQVQIEARIVEASKDFSRQFGVKWPSSNATAGVTGGSDYWAFGGKNSSSTGTWNSAADSSVGNGAAWRTTTSIADPAGELWVSFVRNSFSVNVILQAAEKNGTVKIVSNPKVVTQNNKKAKILAGRKIPYATIQSGNTSGSITTSFVDANLELSVTPQITNDGTILMDLKLTKSEADFGNTVQGTPTILNKELETQVLVKDGGTAILGGVYTSNVTDGSTGIPYLSKIPILGFLFRSKTASESNAELLLFITPRILKN